MLAPESITAYLQRRLLDPIGVEYPGVWSTDREGGLERTWCCLALTARDLARIGRLVLDGGVANGNQVIPAEWLASSFTRAYGPGRWPADYADSAAGNYGYQWWLVGDTAAVAIGKRFPAVKAHAGDRGLRHARPRSTERQGRVREAPPVPGGLNPASLSVTARGLGG